MWYLYMGIGDVRHTCPIQSNIRLLKRRQNAPRILYRRVIGYRILSDIKVVRNDKNAI